MGHCRECIHYGGSTPFGSTTAYLCKLTNLLLKGVPCELFNKDISNEKICYNCKHYLGGNDWGLSCDKEYMRLTKALNQACKDFEVKER